MYTSEKINSVWCNFRQMKNYTENIAVIFDTAEEFIYMDEKKKKYFDATSNMLSSNLGHGKKLFIDSINKQYNKLDSCSLYQETSSVNIDYASSLLSKMNSKYQHIFFTNSGSEACDTSVKIAKKYFYNLGIDKSKIISMKGAYHGSTISANLLCNNEYDSKYLGKPNKNYIQMSPPLEREKSIFVNSDDWIMNSINEFKKIVSENNIAAVILEPLQLSNGAATIPKKFFKDLEKICNKENILIILDEVATGFGYTGTLFAYEQLEILPDMILTAKSMTNGVIPLGGVITSKKIFNNFIGEMNEYKEFPHGFTTSGNPLACSVGIEVLNYIDSNNLLDNVISCEKVIKYCFSNLEKYSFVDTIDGMGFIIGILLNNNIKIENYSKKELGAIIEGFLKDKGLLVYYEGEGKIIMALPLESSKEMIRDIYNIIDRVFKLIENLINF